MYKHTSTLPYLLALEVSLRRCQSTNAYRKTDTKSHAIRDWSGMGWDKTGA
jgi:hypothetical protein